MSGWGCVHESEGKCGKVAGRPCDPGMKGCVLAGRFRFTNPSKNRTSNATFSVESENPHGEGGNPPKR